MWICVIFMCITQIISQMNTLFPSGMKVKVKVVQLCPTLCDPMDYIVHGILQPRILEWVAFPFSWGASQPRNQTQISHIAGGFFTNWAMKEALCDPASPWTVACQAPLPMEFSRQEYWNESSPGDLPNPGIKPRSPGLQADPLLSEPLGKPSLQVHITQTQTQINHHIQPIHFSMSYSLYIMSNISIFIKSVGKDQNEICIWKSASIGGILHLAKRIMRYAFFKHNDLWKVFGAKISKIIRVNTTVLRIPICNFYCKGYGKILVKFGESVLKNIKIGQLTDYFGLIKLDLLICRKIQIKRIIVYNFKCSVLYLMQKN